MPKPRLSYSAESREPVNESRRTAVPDALSPRCRQNLCPRFALMQYYEFLSTELYALERLLALALSVELVLFDYLKFVSHRSLSDLYRFPLFYRMCTGFATKLKVLSVLFTGVAPVRHIGVSSQLVTVYFRERKRFGIHKSYSWEKPPT